jgi:hypothetical protein
MQLKNRHATTNELQAYSKDFTFYRVEAKSINKMER